MSVNTIPWRSVCGLCSRKAIRLLAQESGLALPIVLGVLALGALITAPFLAHASSNMISSATYRQKIEETYSADAGVEHAIWRLTEGGLAEEIPAEGDSTSYTLPHQVNALEPVVTVTREGGGSGGGDESGTIIKDIISSLRFDNNGYNPEMVRVSDGVYALVYRNGANDIVLKTVAISSAGIISQTVIDSQVIDYTGYEPDLVQIAGGVYAVVYRGSSNKGNIATVQIDPGGLIGNSLIDQATFIPSTCREPRIIHTSGEYFLIVYRAVSDKGTAITLRISAGGEVSTPPVSNLVFSSACFEPDLSAVSGSYYAIAFRGNSNRGNLVTIAVDVNGEIAPNIVSSLVFSNPAYTPMIAKIAGSVYSVVYRGPASGGCITTLSISSAGIISSPAIATFQFDGPGYEPYMIPLTEGAYALVYRGASSDGYLSTIAVAQDGTINESIMDIYEFDTANGYEPGIIPVSGSVYAIAFRGGSGTQGYIKTIEIVTSSASTFRIRSVAGGTSITALVTVNNGVSAVTSWVVGNQSE